MPKQVPVFRWRGCSRVQEIDVVADEEALEIHVNAATLTLTMRTSGDDFALAAGLLYGEGLIKAAADITSIRHDVDEAGVKLSNRVLVTLNNAGAPLPQSGWERRFPSTSSCGVCGKTDPESHAVYCCAASRNDSTSESGNNIHFEPQYAWRPGGFYRDGRYSCSSTV